MDFSTDVEPTQPSPAEEALLRESAESARQARDIAGRQSQMQELLFPLLLSEAGFDAVFDEQGNITGFNEREDEPLLPDDPNVELRQQVEEASLERSLAGLEGRIPIDPATEEQFGRERETLRSVFRRQGGPGFETSTPFIQAGSEQEFRQNLLRTAVREGQISSSVAAQASLAGVRQGEAGLGLAAGGQRFGQLFQAPGSLSNQAFLGASAGLGSAAAPLAQNRFFNAETKRQAAAQRSAVLASVFQAIGGVAGTLGAAKILA